MDDQLELTIGEVARQAGLATSSIRYYESIGLLPEPDRLHGQRRYDRDVFDRLGFIATAQAAGFKLGEIKDLQDSGDDLGERMRALSSRKLAEVEELLERTQSMKRWLQVAQNCGCRTPEECGLFSDPDDRKVEQCVEVHCWSPSSVQE